VAAVLVLNTPDDGRLRPKHVEWPCRNKTCTVLHQVDVSFVFPDVMPHDMTDRHKSCGKNCVHTQNRSTFRTGIQSARVKAVQDTRTGGNSEPMRESVTDWGPQNVFQVIRQEACQIGVTNFFFREAFVRFSFFRRECCDTEFGIRSL
jgi:hypothetical protein